MTDISLAPIVNALAPLVETAVATLAGGLVLYFSALLRKWLGIKIDAANIDAIRKAAATEAGALVAASATNLAGESIHVSSPMVASAARTVEAALPGVIKATGLTPAAVAKIVAGEIGKLQAAPIAPTKA